MIESVLLEAENFNLSLDFQVFESDIAYPSNTILSICVSSSGFSASTTMDIDIKAFCEMNHLGFCILFINYSQIRTAFLIQRGCGFCFFMV